MKITRVINNNVVCAFDELGREVVIMGCGLGFGCKMGQPVKEGKIEKVFRMDSEDEMKRLESLLSDVPMERVVLVNEIIDHAKRVITDKIQRTIYITLLDHINFAIERHQQDIRIHNPFLSEVRRFYPREFQVGKSAVNLLNERLGIDLPLEDEAASIALHFINAELGKEMFEMLDITKIIQNAVKITKYTYNMELDEESIHFERFITHLKYYAEQVVSKRGADKEDEVLTHIIRTQYPKAFRCAEKIAEYVRQEYHFETAMTEVVYLALHIERITT